MMNNKLIFGIFFFCLCIVACKETGNKINSSLFDLQKQASNEPSSENLDAYYSAVTNYINDHKEDKSAIEPVMENAVKFSKDQNQWTKAIGYEMPLVKMYPDSPKHEERLLDLAKMMVKINKNHAANILYQGYVRKSPDATKDAELASLWDDKYPSINTYLDTLLANCVKDPDEYGLNRNNSQMYVDAAEANALARPKQATTPHYLYKAAEVARSLRTIPKAMTLYDWIIEEYPTYEKTPTVTFLKGFVFENDFNNIEKAKEIYQQFLDKYPDNELASSVKFLVDNLGKSDEEILQLIEANKKQ